MSVTAPKGFLAAGVAGRAEDVGGLDVALVVNDGPDATAAGVFTANRVKAAPVRWSQQVLRAGTARVVVLNAGGANACTGPAGLPGHPRHRRGGGRALTASGLAGGRPVASGRPTWWCARPA